MTFPSSNLNGWAGFDDLIDPAFEPTSPESLWMTRRGEVLRICDMSDEHLLNTIQMLRGRSPIGTRFSTTDVRRRRWINVMANVAYERGLEVPPMDENDKVHE